eukprot:TRINITY_DN73083_c0_g1_i1.p1 TRINITY_DN73083_c0_g1~~TRINITY_DN73083_c0_g1_i1.p1  ORF type:complete len:202 (+),score=34.97 TRINITY_DN73083_c0_g1_i1:80-607(+)
MAVASSPGRRRKELKPEGWLPDYDQANVRGSWSRDQDDALGEFRVARWGYFPRECSLCSRCGATLDLGNVCDGRVECKFCGFSQKLEDGEDLQAGHTVMVRTEIPRWWKEEDEELARIKSGAKKEDKTEYPEIAMECPQCGHDRLQFWTRQLRSADEGQTTYFLCKKCGWRATEN